MKFIKNLIAFSFEAFLFVIFVWVIVIIELFEFITKPIK